MTNKPAKPINLFDCATSQKVIGQENFLKAFETILNHGGYAQGPETRELDEKLANFSGTKFCATCASGTDALILPLMASPFTFKSLSVKPVTSASDELTVTRLIIPSLSGKLLSASVPAAKVIPYLAAEASCGLV